MEYVDNILDILFACLAATNLHYNLFDEFVEDLFLLLSSDKLQDCTIDTHYGRYYKLVTGFYVNGNSTTYENIANIDNKGDKKVGDDDVRKKKDDYWEERDDSGVKDADDKKEEDDDLRKGDDKEAKDDDGRVEKNNY